MSKAEVLPVAVLDVGGTHVTSAVVDPESWELASAVTRVTLDSSSASEILKCFLAATSAVEVPRNPVWGISMPGPFDYRCGVGRYLPGLKFERLRGVNMRSALVSRIDPRPRDVRFINDGNAFTIGEWLNGSAQNTSRSMGLTLGTGIGSGFLADGRIIESGEEIPPNGNVHELFYRDRPIEESMSRDAIRSSYAAKTGDGESDVLQICQRAREGDRLAKVVLETALRALGATLDPWIARFDPQVLVVGGSISRSWDILERPFVEGAKSLSSELRISVASNADRAPLLGAAWSALD